MVSVHRIAAIRFDYRLTWMAFNWKKRIRRRRRECWFFIALVRCCFLPHEICRPITTTTTTTEIITIINAHTFEVKGTQKENRNFSLSLLRLTILMVKTKHKISLTDPLFRSISLSIYVLSFSVGSFSIFSFFLFVVSCAIPGYFIYSTFQAGNETCIGEQPRIVTLA